MLGLRPPGISNLTEHQLQHSHIHLTPARLTRLLDAKISMSKHHETPCCCLALFFGLTQVHGWCSKPQLASCSLVSASEARNNQNIAPKEVTKESRLKDIERYWTPLCTCWSHCILVYMYLYKLIARAGSSNSPVWRPSGLKL